MLKNYIKTAWRNIIRHKTNAAINVTGLALGMTCCLFIFLWVQDEKSIDNFHQDSKNLYAVFKTETVNGKVNSGYTTPLSNVNGHLDFQLEDIISSIPEIKHLVFYATGYDLPWGHAETIQVGEKILKLNGARAGRDFFSVFSYPLVEGNRETALNDAYSIAISRNMAELFFGSPKNALGKTIRYENKYSFLVTAVFENTTTQSSLKFDFLLNWDAQRKLVEWSSNDFKSFIQISEMADIKKTEEKINRLMQAKQDKKDGIKNTFGLQPYGDQYLYSTFVNGKPVGGRIEYVRIFSGVAIFILIIACINFMNLATARSVKRAKEVGLRKVVGSSRAALIGQFFSESILFSFLAMILAAVLFYLLLPAFNQFTGKQMSYPVMQPVFWTYIVGLTFLTGLVAGSYPAIYLSSLQPVLVLKGIARFTRGSILFRKGLTVFQFVLSITLIITTIVIYRQINYTQNMNLGYDRENLIYVQIEGELSKINNYLRFKQEASGTPGIAMIDRSTEVPHAMDFVVDDAIDWQGKEKNMHIGFKPCSVGFDFLKLMNLNIAEGRGFSKEISSDSADAFMVNEEAVKEMGMKNPIGKWVSAWQKKGHIIGVLKDYHTQSLREPIKPIIIDVKEYEYFGVIIIRSLPGQTKEALASLSKVYKDLNPNYPFAYQYVDEEYKRLYSTEFIISKLSILFSVLAILISCMGLLGLVMFSAEQRIKEFSVRKVLGASLSQIITLFSKDFVKLILIAFCIAGPFSWYIMNNWLGDFAYKITLSWWIFVLGGLTAILIALLTICFQAFRTANANPAKTLRAD